MSDPWDSSCLPSDKAKNDDSLSICGSGSDDSKNSEGNGSNDNCVEDNISAFDDSAFNDSADNGCAGSEDNDDGNGEPDECGSKQLSHDGQNLDHSSPQSKPDASKNDVPTYRSANPTEGAVVGLTVPQYRSPPGYDPSSIPPHLRMPPGYPPGYYPYPPWPLHPAYHVPPNYHPPPYYPYAIPPHIPPPHYLPPPYPIPEQDPSTGAYIYGLPPPPASLPLKRNRARIKTPQDILNRKMRKNAQSRMRAARLREKVEEIKTKEDGQKTEDEAKLLDSFEDRRNRKNIRSRQRALEKKAEIERILAKPETKRTKEEKDSLEIALAAKKRKNEGDRLRRERLKKMGLKVKPPGISIRGRPRKPLSGEGMVPCGTVMPGIPMSPLPSGIPPGQLPPYHPVGIMAGSPITGEEFQFPTSPVQRQLLSTSPTPPPYPPPSIMPYYPPVPGIQRASPSHRQPKPNTKEERTEEEQDHDNQQEGIDDPIPIVIDIDPKSEGVKYEDIADISEECNITADDINASKDSELILHGDSNCDIDEVSDVGVPDET